MKFSGAKARLRWRVSSGSIASDQASRRHVRNTPYRVDPAAGAGSTRRANSGLGIVLAADAIWRMLYCALWTVFPKVISGLPKPMAIQAAISFHINLPE